MSNEVGRPTNLTDELIKQIKAYTLQGKNLKEIAELSQINLNVLYLWSSDNYLNIADKIEGWKRDRMLLLADITSNYIQSLDTEDENGKVDKELLKIKQKEAEFIRETLGKKNYSKRTELSGNDGKDLPLPILYVPTNNGNQKDNGNVKENPSNSGGNVRIENHIDTVIPDSSIAS